MADPVGRVLEVRRRAAFSLIEVIVVIAIMSLMVGAMAPFTMQQVTRNRINSTRAQMKKIVTAFSGDPEAGYFGYVGDIGVLPVNLEDINNAAGRPGYSIDPGDRVGYGYNGPYAHDVLLAPGNQFVDAWNDPFRYVSGTAQLTSDGPDRVFGSADDLVYPANPVPISGNVIVRVIGLPNSGNPAAPLGAADADVWVSWSDGGVRRETLMADPVGGPGPWSLNNLHAGYHGVRVQGTGAYLGAATARDVVRVVRGSTTVTVMLVQP